MPFFAQDTQIHVQHIWAYLWIVLCQHPQSLQIYLVKLFWRAPTQSDQSCTNWVFTLILNLNILDREVQFQHCTAECHSMSAKWVENLWTSAPQLVDFNGFSSVQTFPPVGFTKEYSYRYDPHLKCVRLPTVWMLLCSNTNCLVSSFFLWLGCGEKLDSFCGLAFIASFCRSE